LVEAGTGTSVEAAERFAAAHEALRADTSVQFKLGPPPPPPEPPAWLKNFLEWLRDILEPVERLLGRIAALMPDAPYARIFMWTVLAAAALLLAALLYQRLRHGAWRLPRLRRSGPAGDVPEEEPEWRPQEGAARSWLREADALAAQGRYAEAVHHLLFRSVEDIARRRPKLVRPSLTSRELAGSASLPGAVRSTFSSIAALVERSLFGGRALVQADWTAARSAYSDLVLPGSWR